MIYGLEKGKRAELAPRKSRKRFGYVRGYGVDLMKPVTPSTSYSWNLHSWVFLYSTVFSDKNNIYRIDRKCAHYLIVLQSFVISNWHSPPSKSLLINQPVFTLQLKDEFEYRAMMRMDVDQFLRLADILRPHIKRQDTRLRISVSVEERLSITLTYLAYGECCSYSESRVDKSISSTR